MVLAAILVFVIEREFLKAAWWTATAAVLSMIGLIHAYDLTPSGVQNSFGVVAAPGFAIMYAATAALLVLLYFRGCSSNDAPSKVASLDRESAH
jgi:AGZA family xanthine/uracil permease-like MFS transporter